MLLLKSSCFSVHLFYCYIFSLEFLLNGVELLLNYDKFFSITAFKSTDADLKSFYGRISSFYAPQKSFNFFLTLSLDSRNVWLRLCHGSVSAAQLFGINTEF